MGRIIGRPTIYPFKAADTGAWSWTVDEPFSWEVGPANSGLVVTIEQGFTSDLGSIPSWCRWAFNPADPQCAIPYLIHDKIGQLTRSVMPHWLDGFGSQFAASQLYEALTLEDVPLWSRKAQFFGVCFGISEW